LGLHIYPLLTPAFHHLYKCNISTQASELIDTTDFGDTPFLDIFDNGDLVFSSSLFNGSIYYMAAGTQTVVPLIKNLGLLTTCITLYKNEFYFTHPLFASGSLKKVDKSGNLTILLTNLNKPGRLIFNNEGNLVLETQTTYDGTSYITYGIYNLGAKVKIADLTNDGYLVLSAASSVAPFRLESSSNSLFFEHFDFVGGSINHCNPISTSYNSSIQKIQMRLN
jgi:hypothetical protein